MKEITQKQLHATLRRAAKLPIRKRAAIARELDMSISTLDRKVSRLKKTGRVNRSGRNDKGMPRAVPRLWIRFISAAFFCGGASTYSAAHREVVKRCERRGMAAPSYSCVRRVICGRFAKVMSSGRIRRIGDFERVKAKE